MCVSVFLIWLDRTEATLCVKKDDFSDFECGWWQKKVLFLLENT